MQIKLFDVAGRNVFSKNYTAAKAFNVYHLNLFNLTAGIYYAQLIKNDEKLKIKFVMEK